jgi:CRISPR-associated protein Csh2
MNHDITPAQNRSEIVFLFDAEQCNPNGDPLADDRPRIDPVTGICSVSMYRIKRYIRDQLDDDGLGVFLKEAETEEGTRSRRQDLLLALFEGIKNIGDLEDVTDALDGNNIETVFLDSVEGVRYFGLTLSLSKPKDAEVDEEQQALYAALHDQLRSRYIGPVQFEHARSLHRVEESEHTRQIAPIVAGKEGKEAGTFGLDYRIKYGLFSAHGIVNENAADDTRLSGRDVRRLDSLLWRALKNQTLTVSKFGQQPRLYARVEYARDDFHFGDIHQTLTLDSDKDEDLIRTVDDVVVDATKFIDRIRTHSDAIERVRLVADAGLTLHNGDRPFLATELSDRLANAGVRIEVIEPYTEAEEFHTRERTTVADYALE